ncbi:MAG: hypothetical protein H6995_10140 [Pseudomonadales bacterium]|nr:hypothetical protein [Pseudomonadales bacterium]MCP5215355.1 hypothetical protein [Pseudomonadales bacterium]
MRTHFNYLSWPKAVLLILSISLLSSACSKQTPHLVIKLKQGQLQNLPMGSWLTFFDFDYSEGAEDLKLQAVAKLQAHAALVDEYVYEDEDNKVGARVWDFQGIRIKEEYYQGGVWEGPKVMPAQEYYVGGAAENLWITIEFEKGIAYSELLPDQYQMLDPVRTYEHAVTVESSADQHRRLFLFGYGPLCRRISLF